MENPVFFISEGPNLDNGTAPGWACPAWFHSREKAEAHWAKVQAAADKTGLGIYPNEGIRIVSHREAAVARWNWIGEHYPTGFEGLPGFEELPEK